jgi:4-amino-4-deoxy-L-arabinose transferase-like glycosyltransferase
MAHMATTTSARAEVALDRARVSDMLALVALGAVCVLGAALRFDAFGAVYTTPYYDAAVRSMALSWHNFLYGALEPGGGISIDKTPVDLWLQVASVKLFGFSSVALRLPPAIAGTLALPLLYDLVRRGFGRWAGVAAALALAVLPSTVLTSRSDTMDTVMATLLLAAAWLIVLPAPEHRTRGVIGAGAVAGLAFEVKLFEGVVALPALGVLAWLALDTPPLRRLRTLVLGAVAFLVVASSWAVVASLLPGPHPYPLGSTNGQIWNALLVYNGLHRIGVPPTSATAPGLLRLFDPARPRHFGPLIGGELLAALAFGALALATSARRGTARLARAIAAGLGTWLLLGAFTASFMGRLWPRYLESFTPAVAGVLGIALVAVARAAARRRTDALALCAAAIAAAVAGPLTGSHGTAVALAAAAALGAVLLAGAASSVTRRGGLVAVAAALTLAAALAVPAATALRLVRSGEGDSAAAGHMPAATLEPLSAYLRAHQGHARYEVAAPSILKAASLIVRDARPVLVLAGVYGRPLLTPAQLAQRARAGQVHYVLLGKLKCVHGKGNGCSPVVQWARRHGTDVSRAAGLPYRHMLYRLPTTRKVAF